MDRVIQKKKWSNKRLMTIAGVTGVVVLVAGSIFFTSGKSKLNVDTERITVSEIKKGAFQEFIPVNGVVMPLTTIYLDAVEGGQVEEKYVEDGAMLKKGDPILKLSNIDEELSLASQESAVFGEQTQMQIAHNNAQQNTVSKLNQMADVDNAFKEAERVYLLDKSLYEQKAIGLQEYQAAKNNYDYQVRRKRLTTQILKQDTALTRQQEQQAQEHYAQMKNALTLMRKKVGSLTLRAPIDGQLTSMDAEVGQNKNKGEHLGQIDAQNGFKVRVDIEEHYLSRIYNGLMGDFVFADKTYKLTIKKVYTQVTNGRFQVDMQFVGAVPKGIRKGQTLQIRLALSDETTALLVPKGGFYQQTGGNWIFKVSEDGKTAYKTDIQIGRQNPDYYEVLQGLKPGDKVITSSYESYGDIQELVLKQ
ncbi:MULTISPECIES: efflux RND transporter periplasmic adaptor subunit [unclassified Mucilaginibacter]|uniref:efflux RND transporter periplasmic adaptor subunit n=1 Tax=unclassified Mucilaginibacter TaxID=2617802 RepID=UPI00095B4BE7|nr:MULTISPECIES: efflux RND transporter periplasmic adaptor subunit [unclassified Mucilaginibacter]OJW18603.1 MAG: efflux transporter periplasmic adaptor subunit [Mucilaginibacter sp. 44-25]PLW89366.1 MAG: efflux transporter periplasmic adaptor subunit [Mucilaginibacter sp.]PMP64655.1 MAG: efflux transporter periplasmic adaptor subunit [Mucilaginibacter sp.]HEK20200.1 efflux RND transporter periplasmic adaptor subunit [Bacteroidota bacterium]